MKSPLCLSIAGSDSGGEAGIQADLQCFSDYKCHGLTAITANTAQNPKEILSINPVNEQALSDQLKALLTQFKIDFVKTGLLPSTKSMEIILSLIPDSSILITDPLIESSSGKRIMENEALDFFQSEFLKRVNYLTPNFPEFEILFNKKLSSRNISKGIFQDTGLKGIFLKGGHSDYPNVDYFYKESLWKLEAPKIEIKSSHGTGCRISSALCAGLAQEYSPLKAATLAKNYVYHSLKNCKESTQGQWLMSSPGNIFSLENKISLNEI